MPRKQKIIQNRNAAIRTRQDVRGNLRTETCRRDEDTVSVAVSTNPRSEATRLFIDMPEGYGFSLDGRTARTVYRALQKHYEATDRSF